MHGDFFGDRDFIPKNRHATIQTGRRNDLLKLDSVDLHRVQALCASKADLVVKGPLFPTFALISGISMWTRVMKLKFSIDEIKNVDLGHGGSPAMIQGCSCIAEYCSQAPGLTLSVGSDNADILA